MAQFSMFDRLYNRRSVGYCKRGGQTLARMPSISGSDAAKAQRARFADAARSSKGTKGVMGVARAVGNKLRGGR